MLMREGIRCRAEAIMSSRAMFNIVILGGALIVLYWAVEIYYLPVFR